MKKKLLLFFCFISFLSLSAQTVEWQTNISEAVELSNKNRMPLMILFTANNLDTPLQEEVFKSFDFNKWYPKNVILLRLDLSDGKLEPEVLEKNTKLKNAFGVQEVPVICYANASIKNDKVIYQLLGKVVYDRSGARNWINKSEKIIYGE